MRSVLGGARSLTGRSLLALALVAAPAGAQSAARLPDGITERRAVVDGVSLNYKIGGRGPVVVLLHGYTQTSHMWLPLMPLLAASNTVIAPDLRGAGGSARSESGYDKKTLARDIRGLVRQLGHTDPVRVVGHDIGLMVAYAYAAQYPAEVSKVVLMDAFLPGIGPWKDVWLLRDLWHFHFHGPTAEALVQGRERTYFEHFWNDFAADKARSVPEADRQVYSAAYARDGGIRAGFQYFKAFEQDAADFASFASSKLAMPFLVLAGENASGTFLFEQARLVAADVRGIVIKGSGHWLMEEAPEQVIPALTAYLNAPRETGQRLTADEARHFGRSETVAGTSGVSGIRTSVLRGDPSAAGLYTIQLTIPANTRIEAHDHPDDRVATVISGTWHFGYGEVFDDKALKALPPGSFYAEPPDAPHFARTGAREVVLQITGYGPSGTRYVGRKAP